MRRVLQDAIVKTRQVDLKEPHLERIIQLGVPGTSCPGHDVPFLAIEGRQPFSSPSAHIPANIESMKENSVEKILRQNTFPVLLSLASCTSAKFPRPITRITF